MRFTNRWKAALPILWIMFMMRVSYEVGGVRLGWFAFFFAFFGTGLESGLFTAYGKLFRDWRRGEPPDLNLPGESGPWHSALYSMAPLYYHLALPLLAPLGPARYLVHMIGFMVFEGVGNFTVELITGDHPSRESYAKSRWRIGTYTRWDYMLIAWLPAGFAFEKLYLLLWYAPR